MTQRGKKWFQTSIYDFLSSPNPDMGGTTGGGRERASEEASTPDVEVAIIRDRRSWGPITEPEVFWAYWLKEADNEVSQVGQCFGWSMD